MTIRKLYEDLAESVDLITEGVNEEDMAKSLNSLIKYNQGKWKSEKQASYLSQQLDQ